MMNERSRLTQTPVVLGMLVGLLVAVVIIGLWLANSDEPGVAAGPDENSATGQTVSIGVGPDQESDSGPSDSGLSESVADDDGVTSTTSITTRSEGDEAETDDDDAEGRGGDEAECPQSAGTDNRSSRSASVVDAEWTNGEVTVKLCRSADGALSYHGSSDRGTIYLDAERTADGFEARNRDTIYRLTYAAAGGRLSIVYPAETTTVELDQVGGP